MRVYCFTLLAVALLVASSGAAGAKRFFPEGSDGGTLGSRHWRQLRCSWSDRADVIIALKQQGRDVLEQTLLDISDPQSPNYGNYLSASEVGDIVQAHADTLSAVENWLDRESVPPSNRTLYEPTRDYLELELTVDAAERLFETTLACFEHAEHPVRIVRAKEAYSIPSDLAAHVELVLGLRGTPSLGRVLRYDAVSAGETITPAVIASTQNITVKHDPSVNNSQAVAEFLREYYSPSDLAKYLSINDLPSNEAVVVGFNDPSSPGFEAELDIQVIMGTAVGMPTWFVSQRGGFVIDPFFTYFFRMMQMGNSPYVHSISYSDVEGDLTGPYLDRASGEFQKFSSTGRSILFSSGDDGTGCANGCDAFVPNWPACDPYVTSVGGIVLNGQDPFSASGDVISSGGFSNYFERPSYQDAAVQAYLNSSVSLPSSSMYNASGRAFPDVASYSNDVEIVVNGQTMLIGGTSAACPIVAGCFALLNDARMKAGNAPLGFLNPFIYQTFASSNTAFTDITDGSNPDGCCAPGFECTAGWDPVTGVGLPNVGLLLNFL